MRSFVLLFLAGNAALAAAQAPPPAPRGYAGRADLEARGVFLEGAANSSAYSPAMRARAQLEAAGIRARLEKGDFQVGDRVTLLVENEPSLTDTFTIRSGPMLQLPVIGEVGLAGVLRSELEPHLTRMVSRFVREPQLRAQSLLRVAVEGGVARPGFVTLPSETLLADVLGAAGGAVSSAQLAKMRVTRNGRVVLAGAAVEVAVRDGRTIDQLGMEAGDRVFVPQPGGGLGAVEGPLRALSVLLSIPFAVIALTQIF